MARRGAAIATKNIIVASDVEGFVGVGVKDKTIDNSYNDTMLIESKVASIRPNVGTVTGNFTIDGKYQVYEIDLDTIGVGVTCTWDATAFPIRVTFKIINNSYSAPFTISNTSGGGIDGTPSPYITGMVSMESRTYYASGTELYSEANIVSNPDIALTRNSPTTDQLIPAGYSAYVSGFYEIASGKTLELGIDSILEIG